MGDVRVSGRELRGHGDGFYGHQKEGVHVPGDGQEGVFRGDSDLFRHGFRGDAVRHHHRCGHGREVAVGRLPAVAEHGNRGRGQHDDAAQGLDQRFRHRRHDPRHRVLRVHHGFRLYAGIVHESGEDGIRLSAVRI